MLMLAPESAITVIGVSCTRLRDKYRVQLSAVVVSPIILVANVTMLLSSESGVDRNVIYFVVNKLKTFLLSLWPCALTSGSLHWYNSSPNWITLQVHMSQKLADVSFYVPLDC